MDERLTDGLEGGAVDVLHVVADGVPRRTEVALIAVGIVGDDVDARNLGNGVDWCMVVGDVGTGLVGEHAAEAYHLGSTPYTVGHIRGVLHRHAFFEEHGALTAYHVEQDAITGFVTGDMGIGSPVLRAEGPRVASVGHIAPLRRAPVFSIEADEVDADACTLRLELTGQLEHDGNTRGTIVGRHDGRTVVGGVRIVVGPRTAVPVGTDEDTLAEVGTVAGDDVGGT